MRILRHWKMILGLAGIYGAGCLTGVIVVVLLAKHFLVDLPGRADARDRWVNARVAEYDRRLKLTPEEREKIKPIVQKSAEKFGVVVHNGYDQAVGVVEEAHKAIEAELTPDQKPEFEKISHEILERWRDFARKESAKPPPKPF